MGYLEGDPRGDIARRTAGDQRLDVPLVAPLPYASFSWGADPTQLDENAEAILQKTLSDVLRDLPPVPANARVAEGNAAKFLIDLSGRADLLVVGSRGYGGFAGLLLGSVNQHVVAHAPAALWSSADRR